MVIVNLTSLGIAVKVSRKGVFVVLRDGLTGKIVDDLRLTAGALVQVGAP